MPSYPDSTSSPPWRESETFRETTLQLIDDLGDREAMRHAGRVIYQLAVETSLELGGELSVPRAELRAIAADLRYTSGYCGMVRRSFDETCLDKLDEALAKFAGRLGGRLNTLVKSIEARLALDLERRSG